MSQKNRAIEIRKFYASCLKKNELATMYLDYSGVILRTSNRAIAIDPGNLLGKEVEALEKLDLIIFTHSHGDHYSSKDTVDILKVTNADVLAEPLVAKDLKERIPSEKLTSTKHGETHILREILVSTVKGIHGCSINIYKIKMEAINIFHAGDSGYVSVERYPVDIAFLPTGIERPFTPTSSPENAFKMALELKPSIIVAFHGSLAHSKELANKVKERMPDTTVIIPEPYTTKILAI